MTSGNDGQAATKRGEWVEAKFLARAQECGLNVSRPWGGSSRYDFAIEQAGRFRRVQVKSTLNRDYDGYICTLKSHRERYYTPEEIDFFAIYVVPEDVWYIIPAEVAGSHRRNFFLAPDRKNNKYDRFKEAWRLLTGATESQPGGHQAGAGAETPGPDCGVDADAGRVESLSGLAEGDDPGGAFARRAANSFAYLRQRRTRS